MKAFEQLKKVASENCGACGDAEAVKGKASITAWAMSDGSFSFAVDVSGQIVDMSEKEIEFFMVGDWAIYAASDRRNLAA